MSHSLFEILPSNFFTLLSSPNKDIYIDCLLILDYLSKEDHNTYINKNLALTSLEKYFNDKNKVLIEEETNQQMTINHYQKASKIITLLKRNGWLGEERFNYNTSYLILFDYSLEMIHFFKKTLRQVKPESIGNIYSIYSLLRLFLMEKNYANFHEAVVKTQNLLIKLRILQANIYRFYYQLLHANFDININNILQQLLLDYKKNFFDSSYYLLKTADNFFKYRGKINLFLKIIRTRDFYMQLLSEQLSEINKRNVKENVVVIVRQIQEMEDNLKIADKLIEVIDRKNEQYLQIVCQKILFYDNKKNIQNLLNYGIKIILSITQEYNNLFNLYQIRNLDQFSFYKPRREKRSIITPPLKMIPTQSQYRLEQKKISLLNKDLFYTKSNIELFVKKLLNQRNPYKASDIVLNTQQRISQLMLIFLYSQTAKKNNVYQIRLLNQKVTCNQITFSNFLIF
ncbi:MAG: DUF5716 family protein [Weeping tea tree witches'-broom phytoplasma]|uniref:Wadjet anti-phage system protein JetA family protein n=1 Tax=Candidatus Phytoplasma melaleucae TaxID=2982630 RepID=UPI002939D3FE|nr:DUF5716 family protein [Weeping tea tree witches'-broom phytoplasma]